ncbi:MAG: hypothetical protein V5A62_11815 [Haloarculaceae archaeon]
MSFWFRSLRVAAACELSTDVLEFPTREEAGGAGDCQIFHAEVDPENRSVLVGLPVGDSLFEPEVEPKPAVLDRQRTLPERPRLVVEELVLVSVRALRKRQFAPDPTLHGCE